VTDFDHPSCHLEHQLPRHGRSGGTSPPIWDLSLTASGRHRMGTCIGSVIASESASVLYTRLCDLGQDGCHA
jgi:hypothetical protein